MIGIKFKIIQKFMGSNEPIEPTITRALLESVGRSTFPCFSYFMIPKREWEHIDYNDGHQATTIEQKTCLPMYVRTYAHAAALHCLRMVFHVES